MLLGSTQNGQAQVDDLQHTVIDLEKQLDDLRAQVLKYDELYEYIETRRSLQDAGEGLMERARNFNDMQRKYEDKQYRHEEKSETLQREQSLLAGRKIWIKDIRFDLSLLVFVGTVVAAVFTRLQPVHYCR